jgi:hypothetical protein
MAAQDLVWLLVKRGLVDELRAEIDAGTLTAGDQLISLLIEQGMTEEGSACDSKASTREVKHCWGTSRSNAHGCIHIPRRNLDSRLAGERLSRSGAVRTSSYFRTL